MGQIKLNVTRARSADISLGCSRAKTSFMAARAIIQQRPAANYTKRRGIMPSERSLCLARAGLFWREAHDWNCGRICQNSVLSANIYTHMRAAPPRPSLLPPTKRPVCFIAALSLGNQSSWSTRSVKRRILLLVALPAHTGNFRGNLAATSLLLHAASPVNCFHFSRNNGKW